MQHGLRRDLAGPVHPRTHGEHGPVPLVTIAFSGSSPHTRGTFKENAELSKKQRFIPAHTGNIRVGGREAVLSAVHPRTHGEHMRASSESMVFSGSSPHTRGTFAEEIEEKDGHRFIPAHTGNMRSTLPNIRSGPVHPRTHGEHFLQTSAAFQRSGSSPHTRGTSAGPPRSLPDRRFIPAHAGNITP